MYLVNTYLHLWPAGDPLICVCTSSSLSCSGPDEWGVCAVGVVAISVAPGVDEIVWSCGAIYHSGFGFEVPLAVRGSR